MKCWNPNCDYELSNRAIVCPECGTERPAKAQGKGQSSATLTYDPMCADVDRFGNRCSKIGTRSPTTMNRGPSGTGPDGPWYCRDHDPQNRAHRASGPPVPPPKGFQGLRDILAKRPKLRLVVDRQPGEDDA